MPFTFPDGIKKTFMLALLLAPFLGGCGSEDRFPGSSGNQDPDPLVVDVPLFYIERPIRQDQTDPTQIEEDNIKDPITFHGGAHLYMKIRAEQSATTVDLSARAVAGNVDVRDLDVSPDGKFLLFSLRAPQIDGADEQDQPTWNIWEYDIENDALHRVIVDNSTAELGHDISPHYLSDGSSDRRIIFASSRQQKSRSILLDESLAGEKKEAYSFDLERGTREPALNLHVIDPDTQTITQVTYNQSHDFYPVVMPNGKVVFSRFENYNNSAISLYEMNPDGTQLQILYGHHSQDTGTNGAESRFVYNSVLPDGNLFALVRPDRTRFYGGAFEAVDTVHYVDNIVPTADNAGYSGPAQTTVTDKNVLTDGSISPVGYFSAFYPLWDGTNRAVVSWSQCRVIINGNTVPCTADNLANPGATEAPPSYGIWTYDYDNNTQIPIIAAKAGVVYTDVALGATRPIPTTRYDGDSLTGVADGKVSQTTFDNMKKAENEEAIIHIRSVYDYDGAFSALGGGGTALSDYANPGSTRFGTRPARFLRVVKAVSRPPRFVKDVDNQAYGVSTGQGMREIIGYAPIEPDGSVKVRVPANVALALSVVDADGRRISNRHQNWLSLRPGEVLECKGCHSAASTEPHGRYDAQATSINAGKPLGSTYDGTNGAILSPFANATMAEARVGADEDVMRLSIDLLYSDVWSTVPEAPISLRYEDLPDGIPSPANNSCDNANATPVATDWTSHCRVIINYEANILPIWELDRSAVTVNGTTFAILAGDGQPATCTRCHNPTYMRDNADTQGNPPTQLDLSDNPTDANGIQKSSYVDLFVQDVAKVVSGGSLVDATHQEPALDANGQPILDGMGNPTYNTVIDDPSEGPYLSPNGANATVSAAFFAKFEGAGSHSGYLTAAELRLISEWLDIGAQYYNNHFDAPDR